MFILQYEAVKWFPKVNPSTLSQDYGGGATDACNGPQQYGTTRFAYITAYIIKIPWMDVGCDGICYVFDQSKQVVVQLTRGTLVSRGGTNLDPVTFLYQD